LFFVLSAFFVNASVQSDDDDDGHRTIVLVHGAFLDASGFAELVHELHEHYDYDVIAHSLPGRPSNPNPNTAGVTLGNPSLATYVAQVQSLIEAVRGRVILVGHSFGGMTISQVAENIPHKIRALIYLSAYLPLNGEDANTLSVGSDPSSSLGTTACPFTFATAPSTIFGAFVTGVDLVQPCLGAQFAKVLCPDCSSALAAQVAASELPEPLEPTATPVTLTEANFGRVRKYYVVTLRDQAVSTQFQGFMLSRQHVEKVYAINAGHLSYITQPSAIADFIDDAAHHDDDDE